MTPPEPIIEIQFRITDPVDPIAAGILREYFGEILTRYLRRPATAAEVTSAIEGDPSYGLTAPAGVFLLALSGDPAVPEDPAAPEDRAAPEVVVLGCAGLRLVDDGLGEVKRVYVRPGARGQHLASRLMDEVEGRASSRGVTTLRLDTRSELREAIAMYRRRGYRDIAPFPGSGFADVWMQKDLADTGQTGEPVPASTRST
jgi:ribosomal protein S18 acetylase RimI-like enzyme